MMGAMSSWRVLLVAVATALTAVATATLGTPAERATAQALPSFLSVRVPDHVPVDSRVVLRAHVRGDQSCTPSAACRTAPAAGTITGTITWTLVNARRPQARFRHLSTLEDGRARWRTPQIHARGPWTVKATYTTATGRPSADARAAFRVTRR